jgi:hypothetical protein
MFYNKVVSSLNASQTMVISQRSYAKPKELTDSQKQLQKYATEMQFKVKTSLVGKPYNFQDLSTSLRYMESDGSWPFSLVLPFHIELNCFIFLKFYPKAYAQAYRDAPVWSNYVRNYGGGVKPSYTRKMCIVCISNYIL